MRVGDEDVRHGLAAHRIEQRRNMRFVERAGIDDRDLAMAEDVGDRALVGERPRIVAQDAAHAGHHLLDLARRQIEALVERDVVAHQVPCINTLSVLSRESGNQDRALGGV